MDSTGVLMGRQQSGTISSFFIILKSSSYQAGSLSSVF